MMTRPLRGHARRPAQLAQRFAGAHAASWTPATRSTPTRRWERTREVVDALRGRCDRAQRPLRRAAGAATTGRRDRRGSRPARARLDRRPAAFERVSTTPATSSSTACIATRSTAWRAPVPPRPFVRAVRLRPRSPVARRMGEDLPALHRARALAARWPRPGTRCIGDRRLARARAAARRLLLGGGAVRPRRLPAGFRRRRRRWPSRRASSLERVRAASAIASAATTCRCGGAYGVDLWRPDEVVRDSFAVVVPSDVGRRRLHASQSGCCGSRTIPTSVSATTSTTTTTIAGSHDGSGRCDRRRRVPPRREGTDHVRHQRRLPLRAAASPTRC